MTNEQIVKKLADLPLIVRGSQDGVFKSVRELQEAARSRVSAGGVVATVDDDALVEALAALAHEQWSGSVLI